METYDFDDLWSYSDPSGTLESFRALLPAAEASRDPEYHLQLLTQLARTLGLQHKFAAAHEILDRVEAGLTEETPIARIRYLLERGRAYNSAGEKGKARPLFVEAWERGLQTGSDVYTVDAAHMVAIVDDGDAALEWNLKAIELAKGSRQPRARGWLGSLYNNTGWTLHDRGDYEGALRLFEDAVVLREEQGNEEALRIARWCVGRCLRSLGRIDEAFKLQQSLLVEGEAAGDDNGYTHEELGELLLLMGQPEEARPHFAEAYAVLSQDPWMRANETDRLARIEELSM